MNPKINKFEGLSDDEVMDIATTPNMNPEFAAEAEAEMMRREQRMTQKAVDVAEKLTTPQEASADQGITDDYSEPTPTESVDDDEAYSEYDQEYEDAPHFQAIRHNQNNPKEAASRQREREKSERNAPGHDKREFGSPETQAFYATVENEGQPTKEDHEYSRSEILKDAETNIRNHLDDFLISGLMQEFRTGNKAPDYRKILIDKYSTFIEKRAWTYGIDQEDRTENSEFESVKDDVFEKVIPAVLQEVDQERIRSLEQEALMALVEQGVVTRENELGQTEAVYSIPDSFRSGNERVRRFESRFGAEVRAGIDPKTFLESHGIDTKDAATQNASFRGFVEIAKVLASAEQPDDSKLDWYFENFDYQNRDTMARFAASLETRSDIDDKTRAYIQNYLERQPAYQEYISYLESEEASIEDEAQLGETIENVEMLRGDEAIRRLCEEFGIDFKDVEQLSVKDIEADILNGTGPFGIYRGNTVTKIGEDVIKPYDIDDKTLKDYFDADEYDAAKANRGKRSATGEQKDIKRNGGERRGEDYARMKALFMQLLYLRILKIDPNAEIGFPAKKIGEDEQGNNIILGDRRYLIIRFGCESTHKDADGQTVTEQHNHVIAESTSIYGATYLWYGHEDAWRTDLHGSRSEAIKRPNVSRVIHKPGYTLKYHYSAAIHELGVPVGDIIPAA